MPAIIVPMVWIDGALFQRQCRGRGDRWLSARGWYAYTTRGNTRADALATSLYNAAQAHLPGHRLRTDYTNADPDL